MEFIGTIVTHIYTSRAQLPVQGAAVAVTQKAPGGKHVLLALRTSDESGKTAPIAIPTPAPAAGQAPGAEQPFALCDVWSNCWKTSRSSPTYKPCWKSS